ncbi:helix-turn-helix domain-containing protein [Natronolimnohabitans innermongolicus]|uniref:Bacterio-opsin activator HTH domain-containing protein n=1 Tax=Natronolimnohabitans innermongolicus JCM 12255 TaxID=1227499 RepID=L9WJ11_9EURY|nr:helix-turn-helix domain-containing protein [Natronolimnohabitans innermongolicus]ELY49216.1 Bacterio-opsin activator HTH domain-containing protein [Natronolimnohabitans innermongolicus JCM 12255]
MGLIGRADVGPPPGQEALESVPDMELLFEDIRSIGDEPWKVIVWATGGDFERYESALAADSTIDTYECLTKLPEKRLYRLGLSDVGQRQAVHSISVEHDITIIRLTTTAETEELLARFPSRDAVARLREACLERDRRFKLLNLYEEKPMKNDGGFESRYGVTTGQKEALRTALENGYFTVPRETTMDEIAEDLGISTSALSTRLRRGQQALLLHTLAQERTI